MADAAVRIDPQLEDPVETLRMREAFDGAGKPKSYKKTYRFGPDGSDEVVFQCDVIGNVASHEVVFTDGMDRISFSMRPNRKIMPSRWAVTDAQGFVIGSADQKILSNGAWAVLDGNEQEVFRIVDPAPWTEKLATQMMGGATTAYAFAVDDQPIATTQKEPREAITQKGIRGFLKTLTANHDWVVRFIDPYGAHDLRLVAAAMVLLKDITVMLDQSN